jgi:hypothetical protein
MEGVLQPASGSEREDTGYPMNPIDPHAGTKDAIPKELPSDHEPP